MLNANWPVRTETPRAHLGTATVAQTGPDASGCRGLAIRPPAEYHSAKSRCIAMHRDQSALQASLDPYRWQCQDAPSSKLEARQYATVKAVARTDPRWRSRRGQSGLIRLPS